MRIKLFQLLFISMVSLCLLQCKKGELLVRLPPDTQIFLDSIEVIDANRLSTNVEMHWMGNSPNGYIVGYQISFDNSSWSFTESTDSTFRFRITDTTGKQNITFWARAMDDAGVVDPTPAYLLIPIKNTPPTINFIKTDGPTDTVFSVLTVSWDAADADGNETLDSVYLKLNNGSWYGIPASHSLVTLQPVTPKIPGLSNVYVYTDISAKLQSNIMQGLQIGEVNKLYIRARDNSRAFSLIDSTISFVVSRQKGDLLVINSHSGSPCVLTDIFSTVCPDPRTPAQVLLPYLDSDTILGKGKYDFIDIYAHSMKYSPVLWDPTFYKLLTLYSQVFWISDNNVSAATNLMPLESASSVLQMYLNNGGRLLVSTGLPPAVPTSIFTNNSSIFQFSPMQSIFFATSGSANIQGGGDSLLVPVSNTLNYPSLQPYPYSGTLLTNITPFYPKSGAQVMYIGNITRSLGWAGPNNFIARTQVNGKTNMVFSSIELNRMIGNPQNLGGFFKRIFQEEFNW